MNIMPVEGRLTAYMHNKAALAGVPLNGTFELTPCCNMACKMCYVRMTRQQQEAVGPLHTADEWLSLGKTARDNGMLYLLLTGGEPFLHPQFREILEGLHRMGLILSINSNGTMIDRETVEWLKTVPPSRINITLYGAEDATYERLCGNPCGYTQATRAIEMLREAGICVKLNCSLTPYNCDDLDGIFAYADAHGLPVQATSYMFPPVRRDQTMIGKNNRFTPEEAAYQSARIDRLYYGDEDYLKRMEEHAPMAFSGDSADCPASVLPVEGEGIRCRAGKCSFWVTWEGKMMPCGMFSTDHAPNVFAEDFHAAWEQVKQTASEIRLPRECAACADRDECRNCAAMSYTETGRYDGCPEYRCQMAKAYLPACRRVEREIREKLGRHDHEE